ncbi:MAG: sigma-70 family RNA polymerase sigma factor [Planctomycetaceae bacterium]
MKSENGRDEAWAEFVRIYAPVLDDWLHSKFSIHDRHQREDVVQDTLLVIHEQMMDGFRYDPGKGLFRGFLKVICRNLALNQNRKKKRRPEQSVGSGEEVSATVDDDMDDEIEEEEIIEFRNMVLARAAVVIQARCNAQTYEIFRLCVLEGIPRHDVARQLGIKVVTVHEAVARIKKQILDLMRGIL